MKLAACALSLAVALPLATSAAAREDGLARVQVTSAGLDLGRSSDAATMLRRLDRAAMSVCGASTFSLREVRKAVRASSCYRDGLDRAVAELADPTVAALHRQAAAN